MSEFEKEFKEKAIETDSSPVCEEKALNKIAFALCRAQSNIGSITKNKTVSVTTKGGGKYTFDYADFEAITQAIKKPLSDEQLAYYFSLNGLNLKLVLLHSSGQSISSNINLGKPSDIKDFGSQLTYMKRYMLSALLGIATEDDDDAGRATGDSTEYVRNDPPKTDKPWFNKSQFDENIETIKGWILEGGHDHAITKINGKYNISKAMKENIRSIVI